MKPIQKFKTVRFFKRENGVDYYIYTYANNEETKCTYHVGDSHITLLGKEKNRTREISEAMKEKLLACKNNCLNSLDEFHFAEDEKYRIAYRHEKETLYRFLIFIGEETVYHYFCTPADLLMCFDFETLTDNYGTDIYRYNVDLFSRVDVPLLQSAAEHDWYLYLSLKYLWIPDNHYFGSEWTRNGQNFKKKLASKSKMGLTVYRLIPEDRTYGNDIKIKAVREIVSAMGRGRDQYACAFTIGCPLHNTQILYGVWYSSTPNQLELPTVLLGSPNLQTQTVMPITDEVVEAIRKKGKIANNEVNEVVKRLEKYAAK